MTIRHFFNQRISGRMVFKFDSVFVKLIREMRELPEYVFMIRIVRNFNQFSIGQICIEVFAHIIAVCEANSIKIFEKSDRFWSSDSVFEQQISEFERTSSF